MSYKNSTVWIFVLLALGVILLIIFPSPGMIAFATIMLPLLVAVQAYIILRKGTPSDKTFSDKDWYDKK